MPSFDLIRHITRDRLSEKERAEDLAKSGNEQFKIDPDVEDSIELERHYRTSQDTWALGATFCEEFMHNVQFTKEQVDTLSARGQAALPMNQIYPAVEQGVAMLTTNKPSFQATAREDSDVKTARVIADLLTWVWQENHGNRCLKNVIYDYYVKGRGVMQVYIDKDKDYGKADICFKDIDPLCVYPDPNSKCRMWSDAAHIFVSAIHTREQIEQMWPDASDIMGDGRLMEAIEENNYTTGLVAIDQQQLGSDATINENYHENYRVIERYTKVKMPYNNVIEMFSQEEFIYLNEELEQYLALPAAIVKSEMGEHIVTGDEFEETMQLVEQFGRDTEDPRVKIVIIPEQQAPNGEVVPQQILEVAIVTHKDLLDMGQIQVTPFLEDRIRVVISIADRLYWKGYLPISDYPLIPFNNRHNRNPYPMSDVGFVIPIQKAINKMESLIIANLASSTNVKAFIPKGSMDKEQIELDFAKAGAAIMEYDAEYGVPVIAQPLPVSAGAFQKLETLKRDIQFEMGIHALMQGDASAAPDTHKGTIAIEQFGQRRIRSKLDDIEDSLNTMARVLIPLMQTIYTERKVIRLTQANNLMRESIANDYHYDDMGSVIGRAMDITSGKYDAVVVSGSTLPANRFALLDYYMELYQAQIIDREEVLKKTDVVDSEGVIERTGQIQQLQQMVQQLQDQVKNQQGDLQTREREVYHAKMALEVERGTSKIQNATVKAENDIRSGATLATERQKDSVSMTESALTLIKKEAQMRAKSQSTVKK